MECIDGRRDRQARRVCRILHIVEQQACNRRCTKSTSRRAASIDVAHWGGRGSGSEALGLVLCASRGFHMEIPSQLVAADTSLKDHLSLF